jgi:hypothetical protein
VDPILNPYSPGAGRQPAALVGRQPQLQAWRVARKRIERGTDAQPMVLYGLRGVGKTVLLTKLAREAQDDDWLVAQIEAGAGKTLRESLVEALYGPLADLATPSAGQRLLRALKTALSFKASIDSSGTWSFGVDLSQAGSGGADSGNIELDLGKLVHDLSAAAGERGVGFALVIDEAQDFTTEELAALCAAAQAASRQESPFLMALAGLPSLPSKLAHAKSYAERQFDYHRVEHLPPGLAAQALIDPARAEGVLWQQTAVDHVVEQTGGYPYFLQQMGQEAWNVAHGDTVTLVDARIGVERGLAKLDNGFFRSRWDRATSAEQTYLRAMAADGDAGSRSTAVAERLGRTQQSLGPARANLISKGIIYSPEHGWVAFTVPGMADFIQRQTSSG